jgi:hypothetical protein
MRGANLREKWQLNTVHSLFCGINNKLPAYAGFPEKMKKTIFSP